MAKAKVEKTPARIMRLMAAMSGGQRVILTLRHSEVGDERLYCFERTGKPVGEWTVKRALEMGVLEPTGDGLFPELDSQSYRLANG